MAKSFFGLGKSFKIRQKIEKLNLFPVFILPHSCFLLSFCCLSAV